MHDMNFFFEKTIGGTMGLLRWQHVSEHFVHRWRLEDAPEDLKSSKEGKAFVVRVAEVLRTRYRMFKGGFKKGTHAAPKPGANKHTRCHAFCFCCRKISGMQGC